MPKVKEIHWYSSRIFEVRLERGSLPFRSGDCSLLIEKDGITARPYSISSAPEQNYLGFLVSLVPGGLLSTYLSSLKKGDELGLSPFFGWFYPGEKNKEVFLATGTGISPFLSLARSPSRKPPLACFYGAPKLEDAAGWKELQAFCPLHLALSRERNPSHFSGRITDLLPQVPLAKDIDYYLCGHQPMIDEARTFLLNQGVLSKQIHFEVFFI